MKATWTVMLSAKLFLISSSASLLDGKIGSLVYPTNYSDHVENASISTETRPVSLHNASQPFYFRNKEKYCSPEKLIYVLPCLTGNIVHLCIEMATTVTCRDEFIGNGEEGVEAIGQCKDKDASTVGNITYTCSNGVWRSSSEEDSCISAEIYRLYQEILDILENPDAEKQIPGYLQNLTATVSEARANISTSPANIKKVLVILSLISGAVKKVKEGVITSVLETLDIVVDNPKTWTSMDEATFREDCSLLLQTTDVFARRLEIVNNSISITTQNIILQEVNISSNALMYGSAIVKFNGLVISTGLSGYPYNHPFIISMTFQRNQSSLENASQILWNFTFTKGTAGWNNEDCQSNEQDGDVTCMCDDLASLPGLWYSGAYFPVCDPDIMQTLDSIVYIGMSLSIASLLVCVIIETLVWIPVTKNNSSYARHVCLVNIAISVLASDIWFIIGTDMESILKEATHIASAEKACLAAAFFSHFVNLSFFFWILVMAFIVLYRLVCVFHDTSKTNMLVISFCLGYGCPLIISLITFAVTGPSNSYRDHTACLLDMHETMAFLAFAIPAFIIVALNLIILFVVVAKHLRAAIGDSPPQEEKRLLIRVIKSVPIITPLFGLTWGFGIALIYSQRMWIFLTFAILKSVKGIFILVFGILWDVKTRKVLAKKFALSRLHHRLKQTSKKFGNTG